MLSMKAKYALRALIVLSTNEKTMLQSKAIAQQADVPAKFLETILAELKNHKVVDSKRGIFGGYFLNKPASEIPIGEIVRALDGTLAPLPVTTVPSTGQASCGNTTSRSPGSAPSTPIGPLR